MQKNGKQNDNKSYSSGEEDEDNSSEASDLSAQLEKHNVKQGIEQQKKQLAKIKKENDKYATRMEDDDDSLSNEDD